MPRLSHADPSTKQPLEQTFRASSYNTPHLVLSGWDEQPPYILIQKINTINALSRTRDMILQRKTKFNKTKPSSKVKTESSEMDTLKLNALKLEEDCFDKQNIKSTKKIEARTIEARTTSRDFQKLFKSTKNGILSDIDDRSKTPTLRKRTMKARIEQRPSYSIKDLKKTLEKEWNSTQKFHSMRSCSKQWERREMRLTLGLGLNTSEFIKSSMLKRRRSRMMRLTIEETSQPKVSLVARPRPRN